MRSIISILVAMFLFAAMTAPASANTACSAGMIRNSYGVVGQTEIQGLFCGVAGVVTFKGDGTATAKIRQSCAGMVDTVTAAGTYTVYETCIAVAQIEFSDGDSGTFYFTIVDGGKKLMYVGASPAVGATFVGTGEQL